jgi:hypothetical protein
MRALPFETTGSILWSDWTPMRTQVTTVAAYVCITDTEEGTAIPSSTDLAFLILVAQ